MRRLTRPEIVAMAREIISDYASSGLNLSLRQAYYQFVSRGLCESSQQEYKRIGDTLVNARIAGDLPIDCLEDRGRKVDAGRFKTMHDDVDDALAATASDVREGPETYLHADRWYGQANHVSVWIEKEALAGVFEPTCQGLGVSWQACKGYPSVSMLYDWMEKLAEAHAAHPRGGFGTATVLYFGDHDPDGLEIPEAAERTIGQIRENAHKNGAPGYGDMPDIEFKRIALTREQIAQYRPPPFPAKETSARFAGYVRKTGLKEAWELDALEPRVLRSLIETHVKGLFDGAAFESVQQTIRDARLDMRERMDARWLREVFDGR